MQMWIRLVRLSALEAIGTKGQKKGTNSLMFVYKMSHSRVSGNYESLYTAESKSYFQTVCSSCE